MTYYNKEVFEDVDMVVHRDDAVVGDFTTYRVLQINGNKIKTKKGWYHIAHLFPRYDLTSGDTVVCKRPYRIINWKVDVGDKFTVKRVHYERANQVVVLDTSHLKGSVFYEHAMYFSIFKPCDKKIPKKVKLI